MAQEDGLYSVSFRTHGGNGTGIFILREGRLFGGDSTHAFDGGYTISGQSISGVIRVRRHVNQGRSLLGRDDATIEVKGDIDNGRGRVQGGGVSMEFRLLERWE